MKAKIIFIVSLLTLLLPQSLLAVEARNDAFIGMKSGELCCVAGKGLCQLNGKRLVGVATKYVDSKLSLPVTIDTMISTQSQLFVKSGNKVFQCKPKKQLVFTFDGEDFDIHASFRDDAFYLVHYDGTNSNVYLCIPERHTIKQEFSIAEKIVYITDADNNFQVVTPQNVYERLAENSWNRQLDFFEPIQCAAMTNQGLALSSENYLVVLVEQNCVALLEESGYKQILADGSTLYVVDEEDRISQVDL